MKGRKKIECTLCILGLQGPSPESGDRVGLGLLGPSLVPGLWVSVWWQGHPYNPNVGRVHQILSDFSEGSLGAIRQKKKDPHEGRWQLWDCSLIRFGLLGLTLGWGGGGGVPVDKNLVTSPNWQSGACDWLSTCKIMGRGSGAMQRCIRGAQENAVNIRKCM